MVDEKIIIQDAAEVDPNLLRMLDRGLEDIEAGRTLPHEEAMAEVRRIREARRFAKSTTEVEHMGTDLCVDESALSVLKLVRVIRNAERSGIKGWVNC